MLVRQTFDEPSEDMEEKVDEKKSTTLVSVAPVLQA